jgi:UDPglucose 6-dehydrogenase
MKISIIGIGYVGLVQCAVLAEFGMQVTCVDVDKIKIKNLNQGIIPIYEPGLQDLLHKNAERIQYTTDIAVTVKDANVVFIAVGTPQSEDGSADISVVLSVARDIARNLNHYTVIVNKSTVPVGTGALVEKEIQTILQKGNNNIEFDVVSNPEFLREGKAVRDCLLPDRVVIGSNSARAKEVLEKVYNVLYINQTPFVFTSMETAELIKYASNAFLAVKVSFINEIALLAEKVGANTQEVARGMGMDGRISSKFLHCGPGYGGSCFPKDTHALINIAKECDEELLVINAAIQANKKQISRMFQRIIACAKEHNYQTISILGLSFKPDTDDVRDAPSLAIIKEIVQAGFNVRVFCPEGMPETKLYLAEYKDNIVYAVNEYDAVKGSDIVVLMTEWHRFRGLNLSKMLSLMQSNHFFDLRNVFSKDKEVRGLFQYSGVGGV